MLPTNSTEQSLSLEADSRTASRDVPRFITAF